MAQTLKEVRETDLDSLKLAHLAGEAASAKKAENVVVLDMRPLTIICDYFVICSAGNTVQVRAIADHIADELAKADVTPRGREGLGPARWILLDYGDVVVHVFHRDERSFYNLERLWGDAEVVAAL